MLSALPRSGPAGTADHMFLFNRHSRSVALIVLAIAAVLALGLWLGGHPESLPGFIRSTFEANSGTEVVDEAIEKIEATYYRPVNRKSLVSGSLEGLTASLDDPYTSYLDPQTLKGFNQPSTFTGVGVEVSKAAKGLSVDRVFDRSPAQRKGLREGEVITAVNGRSLNGVPPGEAQKMITGRPGTNVDLTLSHGSKQRTVTLTRATISEPIVASSVYRVGGEKLGWVYLATFSEGSEGEVRGAVKQVLGKGVKGLVLDLRGNGGGLVSEARMIASLFIRSGVVVTTKGRTQPTNTIKATGHPLAPDIPMVVLVDHNTASASEIVTAALQDHKRATVVGTHTYGKGVFQELEPLSNGSAIKVTVGEYYTPNGRNLGGKGVSQGAGITPEVSVPKNVDTPHGLNVALRTLAAKIK